MRSTHPVELNDSRLLRKETRFVDFGELDR
jgi:hypothetical protein